MTQPTPRSRHQSSAPGTVAAAGVASLVQRSTVTVAPVGGWPVTSAPASGLAWAVGAPEMVAVRAARAGVARRSRGRMSRGRGCMGGVEQGEWVKARALVLLLPLLQGEAGWGFYRVLGSRKRLPPNLPLKR